MDFALDPDLLALQHEAQEVGRRAATGLDVLEDSWLRGTSPAFAEELGARGWIGMTWPESSGGGGRRPIERAVVFEALISAGAPLASFWFADRQIGPTLLRFGGEDLQERFLPGILQGRAKWCIGMSEPDAGSDVAGIRTTAHRVAGGWEISGTKLWTSGAAHADHCYLLARTSQHAQRHVGLSEFIVDMDSPGITVTPITDITGDEHFCEVHFDGVRVPTERLVGKEGNAFKQIMSQMELERGGIDRLVSNRRLYDDVRARVGPRLSAVLRDEAARIEGGYVIGRLLVFREVIGQAPPGFSSVTKTFCTEFEQRVSAFCGAAMGAESMLANRVSRSLCYAPSYTLMGGTTQILRNIIGERILGLPR